MILAMWWRLALLGLVGAASMVLAPLEQLVPVDMDLRTLRLLAVVQPAILVVAAAGLGAWFAPKVALDAPAVRAWAEQRHAWPVLARQLPAAATAGLVVGLALVAFAAMIDAELTGPAATFNLPLVTKLLYGGIVEELLLRWGVMSLLVWAAWRLARAGEPVPDWCYWTGVLLAALLFAVGHLPALFLLMAEPPEWLVALVVVANFLPGILFGWLYWRRGLEAAMVAHALAHLFGTAMAVVVGR